MITFETAITLTITLLVGFISIIVTISGKNSQEKDGNKPKSKKIILYITIFFLLCLIVVWLLYFLGDSSAIYVIQQYAVYLLQQVVNVITPVNGKCFLWENYIYGYWVGLIILASPLITIMVGNFFTKEKKPVATKVLGLIGRLFGTTIIFAWLEYYLSFSTYSTFMEFSSIHFFIANVILNVIIVFAVIWILDEFDLI